MNSALSNNQGFHFPSPKEPKTAAALAWCLSGLECHPLHQKVAGLIPGQGTHLGCGLDPQSGRVQEATDPCFSLPLSLPLSLKLINISSGDDF